MPANIALRDYLLTRRSVGQGFLAAPGPSEDELRTLLTIATRVPDHGKLAPWRLVVYSGDARIAVGDRLAEIARKKRPDLDEAGIDIERRQFLPAPLVIGVLSTARPHAKIPEFEQLISAGNVAFNLIHGAYALGYAANWITRWYCFDDEAATMLGAKEGERFVGFVHVGTPTTTIEDRPRPDLSEIVTHWAP
jgi:nitroreductase